MGRRDKLGVFRCQGSYRADRANIAQNRLDCCFSAEKVILRELGLFAYFRGVNRAAASRAPRFHAGSIRIAGLTSRILKDTYLLPVEFFIWVFAFQ